MRYWYVLFVKTGYEIKVMNILNSRLDNRYFLAFIPTKVYGYRRNGSICLKNKMCFPGYVFLKSIYEEVTFYEKAFAIVKTIEDAFYFLNYGRKVEIAMKKEEVECLKQILGERFCIGPSKGIIKEGKLSILHGALKGMEDKIVKIDRHNREAIIEMDILKKKQRITVMLEISKKNDK